MRFVRYEHGGSPGIGIEQDDGIVALDIDADRGLPVPAIVDAATRDPDRLPRSATLDRAAVDVRPPVEAPSKVICMKINYPSHAREAGLEPPDRTEPFMKAPTAVLAPGASIVYPRDVERLDYEAELGVVVGRKARRVDRADALDYVAGVTAFNDVSARCIQFSGTQNFLGKSYDTFAPFGPTLRTLDGIDPDGLGLSTRVNGELRQDSTTAEMITSVPEIVEMLSAVMTLLPGDVIATGTTSGVGIHREDPEPYLLEPGDEVVVTVEGVGELRNPVVAEGESEP